MLSTLVVVGRRNGLRIQHFESVMLSEMSHD